MDLTYYFINIFLHISTGISLGEVKAILTQSHPTLCDLMDCSLSGSSVHGISQARILEWVAIPFSLSIVIIFQFPFTSFREDRTSFGVTDGHERSTLFIAHTPPCPPILFRLMAHESFDRRRQQLPGVREITKDYHRGH